MLPYGINEGILGVPYPTEPVFWNMTASLNANLLQVSTWSAHYQERLPTGTFIDEAAIMVPSTHELQRLADMLTAGGWVQFNNASDIVCTSPFGTRYAVEYTFFKHPDFGYRLEVMMMTDDRNGQRGFSPLHAALQSTVNSRNVPQPFFPIPHLSFKPVLPEHTSHLEDEGRVAQKRRSYGRAVQHLMDRACLHVMSCQSTYGQFGYFIGNDTARQIYLKPRINLRDGGGEA